MGEGTSSPAVIQDCWTHTPSLWCLFFSGRVTYNAKWDHPGSWVAPPDSSGAQQGSSPAVVKSWSMFHYSFIYWELSCSHPSTCSCLCSSSLRAQAQTGRAAPLRYSLVVRGLLSVENLRGQRLSYIMLSCNNRGKPKPWVLIFKTRPIIFMIIGIFPLPLECRSCSAEDSGWRWCIRKSVDKFIFKD